MADKLKDVLSKYKIPDKKSNVKSERADVLRQFLEELNLERALTSYPPLKANRLAVMLAHLDTWDLKLFLANCKQAKHFSKYFWFQLKTR
jgi:hypothetical protein